MSAYFDRLIRQSGLQVGETLPVLHSLHSRPPSPTPGGRGTHSPTGTEPDAEPGLESFTIHEETVDASAPRTPAPDGIQPTAPAWTPSRPSEHRIGPVLPAIDPSRIPNAADAGPSDTAAARAGIAVTRIESAGPAESNLAEVVPSKDGSGESSLGASDSSTPGITSAANGIPPELLESVMRWIASATSPERVSKPAGEPSPERPASSLETPPLPAAADMAAHPDPLPWSGVPDRLITMTEEVLAAPAEAVPPPSPRSPRPDPQPAAPGPVHVSIGSILVRVDAPPASPVSVGPPARPSSPRPAPPIPARSGGGGSRRLRRHYLVPH